MFGIDWSELMIIAVVAIIVIGPKDLPKVMRSLGKATVKMRTTAAEFRQQFDEAMKDAELDDIKSALDEVRNLDPRRSLTQVFDPFRDAAKDVRQSISETNDALKGISTPSLEDRAILDSKQTLPPANYENHGDFLMSDSSVRVHDQNHFSSESVYSARSQMMSKSKKHHASFDMKRPLRQHRLKHNAGRFSRNAYGKKATRYYERSLNLPASREVGDRNLDGAKDSNE